MDGHHQESEFISSHSSSSSSSDDEAHHGAVLGGATSVNTKIMVAAVVVLFIVILFILVLHIYARWFWRTARLGSGRRGRWASGRFRRRRMMRFDFAVSEPQQQQQQQHQAINTRGLDKAVLEALPVFFYTRMGKSSEEDEDQGLDCAVCLSEFEEKEAGRRLPRCNHVFHTECIDMWFSSHTTCPLCRSSVVPDVPEGTSVVLEVQVPDSRSQGERLLQESVVSGLNAMAIQILQDESSRLLMTGRNQDHTASTIPTSPRPSDDQNQVPEIAPSHQFLGSEGVVKSPRHLVIEVPRRSSGLNCSSSSQIPSPSGAEQRSPLGTHLRNIRRLLSRDSRRGSMEDTCDQQCHTPSSVSGCQTPTSQC